MLMKWNLELFKIYFTVLMLVLSEVLVTVTSSLCECERLHSEVPPSSCTVNIK